MTYREILIDMVKRHHWIFGAELGVWQGKTMFALLDACPDLSMVGVDRWQGIPGRKSKEIGTSPKAQRDMDQARGIVMQQLWNYDCCRCKIVDGDTAEVADAFDDMLFDFVFVDADHSEDGVRRDIEAWRPKVRADGMMIGHDEDWPSVRRALEAEFGTWTKPGDNLWAVKQ